VLARAAIYVAAGSIQEPVDCLAGNMEREWPTVGGDKNSRVGEVKLSCQRLQSSKLHFTDYQGLSHAALAPESTAIQSATGTEEKGLESVRGRLSQGNAMCDASH
jgi:hypothetical protein